MITKSVQCLDSKRLGKQRLEALQVYKVLTGKSEGYLNHPVMDMWMGYSPLVAGYYNECLAEWEKRGFKNSMETIKGLDQEDLEDMPWWWGWDLIHYTHKGNLLRKAPDHYFGCFGKQVDTVEGYWWPNDIPHATFINKNSPIHKQITTWRSK